MMAQWAEKCRRIFNIDYQYITFIDWINYYFIAKHNGMAPIKIYSVQVLYVAVWRQGKRIKI